MKVVYGWRLRSSTQVPSSIPPSEFMHVRKPKVSNRCMPSELMHHLVFELQEGLPRFPALQNFTSQGLGWALFGVVQYLFWVLACAVPYLEFPFSTCSLVNFYSSFKSQLQHHLLCEAFTKRREMLTHCVPQHLVQISILFCSSHNITIYPSLSLH